MKLSVTGENPIERLALALGLAPEPLMHTHMSFIRARAIMVATRLGLFEALAGGALTADRVAERCGTSPFATTKLLDALVGSAYLRFRGGAYSIAPVARTTATCKRGRAPRPSPARAAASASAPYTAACVTQMIRPSTSACAWSIR